MSEWKPIVDFNGKGKVDVWVKWWESDTDTFKGKRVTDCVRVYDSNASGDYRFNTGNTGQFPSDVKVTHFMLVPDPPEGFSK